MDDKSREQNIAPVARDETPSVRDARLADVITSLENNLSILEELELTMAAALVDHAIAEVRKNLTNFR